MHRLVSTSLLLAAFVTPGHAQTTVHGTIEYAGAVRIVHVWGSSEDMGYAHGYLVGDGFIDGMKELFVMLPPAAHRVVDLVRSRVALIDLDDERQAELRGLYRGMVDRHGLEAMNLPGLERSIDETDLLVWNGYDMFRAVGCSGFTCWGERSADGGVITARTLDLGVLSLTWVTTQVVLVRHPTQGKATVSVTPAGLIGVMTGINEDGVCGFLHDGNGPTMDAVLESERPAMMAIRTILEQSTPETAFEIAQRELESQGAFPYSYLLRFVRPTIEGSTEAPVRVFRLDADGVTLNAHADGLCVTTNHYVEQDTIAPQRRPGNSIGRYRVLHGACDGNDRATDPTEAWNALGTVAADHRQFITLHAVVVMPDSAMIDVAIAREKDGRLVPATACEPVRLSLRDLCAPRSDPGAATASTSP